MIVMPKTAYANALVNGSGLNPASKFLQNILTVVRSQLLNTNNKPTGKNIPSRDTWGASKNAESFIISSHTSLAQGAISITFVGETHNLSKDVSVANSVIQNHTNANLIFYERGLHSGFGGIYNNPAIATNTAREEDITTSYGINWGINSLSFESRNLVIAGYLVLCVASGNQNNAVKIILLFGENHVNILHQFNQIASRVAPWLLKRKRILHFVKSHDTHSDNKWGKKKI
jgi:hypothetical protein